MSDIENASNKEISACNGPSSTEMIESYKVQGKASVLTRGGDGGIPEYFEHSNPPTDSSQGNRYS
ncbi:acinetodin/klebsidin/J25 family lasso peptide [Affinibrenneria salicis]|uniref:Acinetodin/klebsidin/J25 family lasso peptide n=1 Tax=Affinibrenneria salicis TaxID=2590031 RepID=A0A5J5FQ74_9GAMM|nr:acinetodin/klebsidin/J25 family lasso peptide [Affinibrenneria salicis]KAA8994249.1 acinetodin/klebsidin/J25 family lasso peptide [Affinibrenneria salicis]